MTLLDGQSNVSPQRGMPVDDKGASSSIVDYPESAAIQLYYYSGSTRTADAGEAAGAAVVGQLTYDNIKNVSGAYEASAKDTSLSFTSTALTTEVQFDQKWAAWDRISEKDKLDAIAGYLSNGEFAVDYATGAVYGLKTTTTTTLTGVTYKIKQNSISSAASSSASDSSSLIGASTYTSKPSGTNADSTTAYATGTSFTVTGLSFLFTKNDVSIVEQIPTAGDSTFFTDTNDFVVTGTLGSQTITIATGVFAASDTFKAYIEGDKKAYDKTNNAGRVEIVNTTWEEMTNADVTSAPNSTVDYYFSMDHKKAYDIQFEKVSGTDTVAVVIWGTNDNDSIANASKTYISTGLNGHGIASGGALAATYTDDFNIYLSHGRVPVTVKVSVTWAGAAIDGAYKLIARAR